MQLRYILRINQAMRKDGDRAYPHDMTEEALEGITHFSENAGKDISILDMDILHVVRALMKKEDSTLSSKGKATLEKAKELLSKLDFSLKTWYKFKLGADLVDSMFFFHGSKGSVPQGSWQS